MWEFAYIVQGTGKLSSFTSFFYLLSSYLYIYIYFVFCRRGVGSGYNKTRDYARWRCGGCTPKWSEIHCKPPLPPLPSIPLLSLPSTSALLLSNLPILTFYLAYAWQASGASIPWHNHTYYKWHVCGYQNWYWRCKGLTPSPNPLLSLPLLLSLFLYAPSLLEMYINLYIGDARTRCYRLRMWVEAQSTNERAIHWFGRNHGSRRAIVPGHEAIWCEECCVEEAWRTRYLLLSFFLSHPFDDLFIIDYLFIGLYRGMKPNPMPIKRCAKTDDIIEPRLKPVWWVNCKDMAARALDARTHVNLGIFPESMQTKGGINGWQALRTGKTITITTSSSFLLFIALFIFVFILLRCISRQLYWGHRIPVYLVSVKGCEAPDTTREDHWVAGRDYNEALSSAIKKFSKYPSPPPLLPSPSRKQVIKKE